MVTFREETPQDLIQKIAKKSWAILFREKKAGNKISRRDAISKALQGNDDLKLPSDILERVSLFAVEQHMITTANTTREKNRGKKEAEKLQPKLRGFETPTGRKRPTKPSQQLTFM